jgi:putative PEP-CTERM system TPR-repeat lipoprotein
LALLSGGSQAAAQTADQYLERAANLEKQGAWSAALIETKNAVQSEPASLDARLKLALIHLKNGNGVEAEHELTRALDLGADAGAIMVPLGEALLLQGDYQRLLDKVTPEALGNPQSPDLARILRLRGDAMLMLGRGAEGCEIYTQSKGLDSGYAPTYRGLAQCALAANNRDEARALLDEALRLDAGDQRTWIALGNLNWSEGKLQPAADAYSNALKIDPSRLDALFYRAQIQVLSKRPSEAAADRDLMKGVDPRYFGVPFIDALLSYEAQEPDKARESLRQVLEVNPGFAPARLLSALLSHSAGNYQEAADSLRAHLRQAPQDQTAGTLLAATYLRLQDPKGAMDLMAPRLQAGTADPAVLIIAGEAQLRGEGAAAALPLFEQAEKQAPDNAAIRTRVGETRLAAGDEAEGIKDLEAASALDPKDQRADLVLAYRYLKHKQFDKALKALTVLEQKVPDNPGTHNLKGLAYQGKGDTLRARESFEKALALRPSLVSAAMRLAQMDLAANDLKAAKGRYASVLEHDANSIPAMVGLAELAEREGDMPAYQDWLTRAAAVSPAALVPRILLAKYYAGKADMDPALSVAQAAVAGRPTSADAWELLGDIQMLAKQPQNASASYKKLAVIAPKSAAAYTKLGRAEAALGNKNGARVALRQALELKPDDTDALLALHEIEDRDGNAGEVKRIAQKLKALGVNLSASGAPVANRVRVTISGATGPADSYKPAIAKARSSLAAVEQHRSSLKSTDAQHADDQLLAWLAKNPADLIARSYLAESYLRRQREGDAIKQYEDLLTHAPDDQSALNNLAVLYQRAGDPRALATARKVHSLDPKKAAYADTLGWILVQQGENAEGLKLLEQATRGKKIGPETRLHYVHALAIAGRTTQAHQELGKLGEVPLDPELERLRRQVIEKLR